MSKIDECAMMRAALTQAGVPISRYDATPATWMIEIKYFSSEGHRDLRSLTNANEVAEIIDHWCPACGRLDRQHFRLQHGGK
jgi:hypothetical protein